MDAPGINDLPPWFSALRGQAAEIASLRARVAELEMALREVARIIEAVDNRCMAVDGPVTPTLDEMTQAEISKIYKLAKGHRQARAALKEGT